MNKKFNFKGFISILLLLSFVVIGVSGIVLFIMPHGRIAYWLNWKMVGINKTGWETLHSIFAFSFIIIGFIHLFVYNWKIFKSYLVSKRLEKIGLNREIVLSVVLTLVFITGSLLNIPPFSTIMDMGEEVKKSWISREKKPPFPHAELMSVREICRRENIDLEKGMERMRKAGIVVESPKRRLAFIARDNNVSARSIFLILQKE